MCQFVTDKLKNADIYTESIYSNLPEEYRNEYILHLLRESYISGALTQAYETRYTEQDLKESWMAAFEFYFNPNGLPKDNLEKFINKKRNR